MVHEAVKDGRAHGVVPEISGPILHDAIGRDDDAAVICSVDGSESAAKLPASSGMVRARNMSSSTSRSQSKMLRSPASRGAAGLRA